MSTETQIDYYTQQIEYRKKIESNFIAKNKKIIEDLETKKTVVENIQNNHSNIRNFRSFNY